MMHSFHALSNCTTPPKPPYVHQLRSSIPFIHYVFYPGTCGALSLIRKSRRCESPVFYQVDGGTKKAGLQRIRLEKMHREDEREETES